MQIAIFYNSKTNPQNIKNAREVALKLKKNDIISKINPNKKELKGIDLAISAGGDGTILYASEILAKYDIPILGINFGHKGYLCQLDKKNFHKKISRIKEGKYKIEKKIRLEAIITNKNNQKKVFEALNEIAIGGINRTVYLEIEIIGKKGKIKSKVTGDGLIISTKTGSTAYNINAGGPVLLTDALSIVANNAFFQSKDLLPITKSIISSTNATIEIKQTSLKTGNLPHIIADGIKNQKMHFDDKIIIKKSENKNYFITF